MLRRDGRISVNVWDFYDFRECYVRENYVVPNLSCTAFGGLNIAKFANNFGQKNDDKL